MTVIRRAMGAAGAGLVLALGLLALDRAFPPPLERASAGVLVTDRHGQPLRAFPVEDGRWRLAADLDGLDAEYLSALIAFEDQRFWRHPGVDVRALMRAAFDSARAGRVVSGASTITMQTARLLEPRPRTLAAKLLEMLRAVQIERRLSKREILEVYLTLAPYGGNLEGVRAASHAYFGREPGALTPEQTALLLALPQSPEARRPDLRPNAAIAARNRVLDRLALAGVLATSRAEEAKSTPAPSRRRFPSLAWHAAERIAATAKGATTQPTTLDRRLQQRMEALARRAAGANPDLQVAILVTQVEDRAVRASVGSAHRPRPGGWLDLTQRLRSPGSTLKPLIYGLAFDDGVASANTLISDAPVWFAGYRPENFDRVFHGDVRLADALRFSLNTPAVTALNAVGADRFAAVLDQAGAAPALPGRADPAVGLALALGGAGLTLSDLVTLYAALADEGRVLPLTFTPNAADQSPPPRRLMSKDAAQSVLAILRASPAPAGRASAKLTRSAPKIAFKTGTSYGFRDAWAVGSAGGYVVGVWVGRPDGAARHGVTGRDAALPVLFDAFDILAEQGALVPDHDSAPPPPPAGPLDRLASTPTRPEIVFPPEGAAVVVDRAADGGGQAMIFAGRGQGGLAWYVDGAPIASGALGEPVWRPPGPGFYAVTAVDAAGRSADVFIQIVFPSSG